MAPPPLNAINPRWVSPPNGLEYASFINGDGAALRYASVQPPRHRLVNGKPVGVAFLVTGFRENIERYYEVMHDLTERGYAVHAMDWRGQGGSQRYHPDMPQRPNAQGYENDAADLNQFITQVIRPHERYPGIPKALFAHSMGGNISLRFLHDYPDRVDAAVITSPMLALKTRGLPSWAVRQVCRLADRLGASHRYATGGGDFDERELGALHKVCNDRSVRQHLHLLFYRDIPEQRLGRPTFGWLSAAFKSIGILRDPAYLAAIKTPIFLASAGQENLVWPQAIKRASKYLPNSVLHHFPKGLHSLWMEDDNRRQRLWLQADRFLHRHLGITPLPANIKAGIDAERLRASANDNKRWAFVGLRLASGPETRVVIKSVTSWRRTSEPQPNHSFQRSMRL